MSKRLITATLLFIGLFSTVALADCKADIQSIMKSMETSPAYRVEITSTSSGSTTVMKGEVIMPHSMSIKSTEMSMVMTPNGVWMGKGKEMQKMPDGMRDQMQDIIKQGINFGTKAIEAEECVGATTYEGGSYVLYKYTAKGEVMGINSTSSVEMYANSDGLPEWMVIDGEAMGVKSLTKQRITYDDSITIPDPT
jgi:hypothetical protein